MSSSPRRSSSSADGASTNMTRRTRGMNVVIGGLGALSVLLAGTGVAAAVATDRGGHETVTTQHLPPTPTTRYIPRTTTTRPNTTEADIAALRQRVPGLTYADARYLVTVCYRLPVPRDDDCVDEFIDRRFPSPTTYRPPPTYVPPRPPTTYRPPPTYTPTPSGPTIPYPGNGGGPTQCSDGTVSNSSGSGTCSHHGGIRR